MTEKIVNGDYVYNDDSVGLQMVDYMDEILQKVKMLLVAHRGKFYPNKDFGTYLSTNLPIPTEEYALAMARLALEHVDGVFVNSARFDDDNIIVSLTINSQEKQVIQKIENYI